MTNPNFFQIILFYFILFYFIFIIILSFSSLTFLNISLYSCLEICLRVFFFFSIMLKFEVIV
jgi:hypothetical protein